MTTNPLLLLDHLSCPLLRVHVPPIAPIDDTIVQLHVIEERGDFLVHMSTRFDEDIPRIRLVIRKHKILEIDEAL